MNPILWQPSDARIAETQMTNFREHVHQADYTALYDWSIKNVDAFWEAVWNFCEVRSHTPYHRVRVASGEMLGNSWFPGATLNYAENCLWRRDDHPALIFHREDGRREQLSYADLAKKVAAFAAVLKTLGVKSGDRVAGFVPNSPEAIISLLACSSIGAIWSSCSPDFGVQGVVDRFGQIEPKIFIACNGYFYNGKIIDCRQKVAEIHGRLSHSPHLIWINYIDSCSPPENSLQFSELCKRDAELVFEPLPFHHPLYILFSSGTTGVPKCIVHGAGGSLLQHLKEHRLHGDLRSEDVLFYFTTCGWMMWNWLVSGLAVGATLVLYDGSPTHPKLSRLWEIAAQEKISHFGTSAKYLATLSKEKLTLNTSHDLSALRTIYSTGSPLLASEFDYVYQNIKSDLCLSSISGGTDIVSCFALGNPVLPVRRGELQCRGLGLDVAIFNEQGQAVIGEKGELVCRQPFPNMPIYFWNDVDFTKYRKAYFSKFPGVWAHGDFAELTENGGVIIYGRSDAVLNPGGVRIGTAEIYRQVEKIPEILESLAVGQDWQQDVRVILFVILRNGVTLTEDLIQKIKQDIRNGATPRHVPAVILQAPDLPRTINGKLVELAVRNVIHGQPVENKESLANPESLDYFKNIPELSAR